MKEPDKQMHVPGFTLSRQNSALKEELLAVMNGVIDGGMFILGENVKALEEEVTRFCRTGFAVGMASGSDALYLSLLACGIGAGDEVITTPFTFYATAGAVVRTGATPVFADIEPETLNIDPFKIEDRITPRTKAVIPVHLYGCPARMQPLLETARRNNLKVIEDAAQALGAACDGAGAGTAGDAGCFSFFPTKNLGAFGDGGMVVTADAELARRMSLLRVHGAGVKYYHTLPGCNSRLDEIQAAVLRLKLRRLDLWNRRRREIAAAYSARLQHLASGSEDFLLPQEPPYAYHVYHQYTVQTNQRDELQSYLKSRGIGTTVYYPLPLHLQEVFSSLGCRRGDFPAAEKACARVLSLPMFPELTADEIDYVAETILRFFKQ